MRIKTFKIDEELLREAELMAQELGLNFSDFVRKAIKFYIEEEKRKRKEHLRIRLVEVV